MSGLEISSDKVVEEKVKAPRINEQPVKSYELEPGRRTVLCP